MARCIGASYSNHRRVKASMQNIAIIISVSKYDTSGNDLPGCERDGQVIKSLLEFSGRFDQIKYHTGNVSGADVKSNIAEFIEGYNGMEIGDVVFYFSGHGEYFDNEFYYLMSDYSQNKRKQTSLDNTSLDTMVRSLSPNMFVKIVDACHSGTQYIKDYSALEKHLKLVGNSSFNNVSFMFSSQVDEVSYQDDNMSHFTNSIVSAVRTHKNGPVRYKHITDYVSDEFDRKNTQTPFFVGQSRLTEIFLTMTDEIRVRLAETLPALDSDTGTALTPIKSSSSFVEILIKRSDEFLSKEEASAIIINMESFIHGGPFSDEIAQLYTIQVDAEGSSYPPQPASIGVWIEKNNDSREYFAHSKYRSEQYTRKEPKNALIGLLAGNLLSGSDRYDDVVDYRNIMDSYVSTASLPYNFYRIHLVPQYATLAPEDCFIAFISSRSHIRIFWSFTHYEYTDWEISRPVGKMDWFTDGCKLKDSDRIEGIFQRIITEFCVFVEGPIKSKWGADTDE